MSLKERVQSDSYLAVLTKGTILSHSSVTFCDKISRPENQHNISVATWRPPKHHPLLRFKSLHTDLQSRSYESILKKEPSYKGKNFSENLMFCTLEGFSLFFQVKDVLPPFCSKGKNSNLPSTLNTCYNGVFPSVWWKPQNLQNTYHIRPHSGQYI